MSEVKVHKLYHCAFALSYHFVFVTKYRRRCLTPAMLDDLAAHIARLVATWEGRVIEFNGEADHVHLLVELTPKVAPSVFANNLKTVTSRLLRRDHRAHLERIYRKQVLWSRSYFVASTGGAPLSIIRQYIGQQERPA